jgi:hypothetical protein
VSGQPDIDRALAFVATAEAGVLDAYRHALRHYPDETHGAFKAAVLPAVEARRVELMRLQQGKR